jgi:SAM-dependent methyltransferase
MTTTDVERRAAGSVSPGLFAATIFASAGLVFLVQPVVARLMLPLLGGGPSVWNTSMAFFQAALLAGYFYANALQRLPTVRAQVLTHVGVLLAAAVALPLRVSQFAGPPSTDHPALWLLGALALSIGAPFAALSATAPLVQAWYARTSGGGEENSPYWLYAASNLGSLLALLAYPLGVEPLTTLHAQTVGWSLAYGAFVLLLAGLGIGAAREPRPAPDASDAAPASPVRHRDRLAWLALAAVPSSLMLGVTTYLTTDVASAPFLWVAPLALYLLTFVIAFQRRPVIPRGRALLAQAAGVAGCAAILPFETTNLAVQLGVHLGAFFFSALVCHQALVARRPDPSHLTEFYLWMSVGGVVGGGFNAFLAPVIFSVPWEYPLALLLSCLARPLGDARFDLWRWPVLMTGVSAAGAVPFVQALGWPDSAQKGALVATVLLALLLRNRAWMFAVMVLAILFAAQAIGGRLDKGDVHRSFFGVVRISDFSVPGLGGPVKLLSHGTTLHGAQARDPRWRCRPLTYYAPETAIGQVFGAFALKPAPVRIGAVGLGSGAVAVYTRPGDHLTFFEIDPLVVRLTHQERNFTYTTECAGGRVDFAVGDARLTLARQPPEQFDILLIDAFSSDAVPAHLLTAEAIRLYLARLKPEGVLILHLSNRHLDLRAPAMASAAAAGGSALLQRYRQADSSPSMWESSEDVLIVARNLEALAPFAADRRWRRSDPTLVRAWTDDYTNLAGALIRQQTADWRDDR